MDSRNPNYENRAKPKRIRKQVSSQIPTQSSQLPSHNSYQAQYDSQNSFYQTQNPSYSNFSQDPSQYGSYSGMNEFEHGTSYGFDDSFERAPDDGEGEEDENEDDIVQPTQQYFTNLVSRATSQQAFFQSPVQPASDLNSSNKRVWSTFEDEALISAYMNTSSNQLVGTGQKKGVFWKSVWEAFEAARSSNPNEIAFRNVDMVKGRWGRIASAVLKWAACYDEALTRKRSGQNDEDVLREAHILHERKNGRFILIHCWELLCKFSKWKSIVVKSLANPRGRPKLQEENVSSPGSGSSGKRPRCDDNDSFPNTPTSGEGVDGSFSRPEGVKKAKSRLKGVAGEAIQCFNSFNERLRLHSESRMGDAEREMEKLEVQRQKVALKKQQMELETRSLNLQEYRYNWEMLQTLSSKENRLPFEDSMLQQLTTWFENYKRE